MTTVRTVILAGGEGSRLGVLTTKRAKPAVPFAGKYRIIDFPLTNIVNSGLFDALVLTQYRPHSLNDHIRLGRPWDLDRSFSGGVQLLQPYKGRFDTDWYRGTADAVAQNANFVRRNNPTHTLILSGDHIYAMDYRPLIRAHEDTDADVTICVRRVPIEEASRFGILFTDDKLRVKEFLEKPANPPGNLANMGVYMFKTPELIQLLKDDEDDPDSKHDFGHDIIPKMIDMGMKVFAYPFNDYWVDVGTIEAYWQAHMDLLGSDPLINLNNRDWIIHTRSEERGPVQVGEGALIRNSMVTNGTQISNEAVVENSVLSPGVYIGKGAVVRDSIIMTDTRIEDGAVVQRCIVDKQAIIGRGTEVGRMSLDTSKLGLTTVGKNAIIPDNCVIGCDVIIGTDTTPEHIQKEFPDGKVTDKAKIHYASPK
jgi:glucose-1-phosphate adenylyltransferase